MRVENVHTVEVRRPRVLARVWAARRHMHGCEVSYSSHYILQASTLHWYSYSSVFLSFVKNSPMINSKIISWTHVTHNDWSLLPGGSTIMVRDNIRQS